MAKSAVKTAAVEPVEEQTSKGRLPDYAVLLRQQPTVGKDGKLYRSEQMSVVGSAWKTEKVDEQTGELVEYIGVKAHVKFEVGPDGLLLRTYREPKK